MCLGRKCLAASAVLALAGLIQFEFSLQAAQPLTVPRSTAATVGPEAKAVAAKEGASFLTQLQFKPKSYVLDRDSKLRMRELITKASGTGRIDTIHLIVWSDQEYPAPSRKSLAQNEVRLADRRAKAVNDYLRDREVKATVEAYNMAERPNTIQSVLSTADARIKRTLEGAGLATTAQDINRPEYAGKVVVLVLLAKPD